MRYSITKEEFTETADALHTCAVVNNCDKCDGRKHCDERWIFIEDNTEIFSYLKGGPPKRIFDHEPNYDTSFACEMLKRKGFHIDD